MDVQKCWSSFFNILDSFNEVGETRKKKMEESVSTPEEAEVVKEVEDEITKSFQLIINSIIECELDAPLPLEVFEKGKRQRILYENTINMLKDFYKIVDDMYKKYTSLYPFVSEYLVYILVVVEESEKTLENRLKIIDMLIDCCQTVISEVISVLKEYEIFPQTEEFKELCENIRKSPFIVDVTGLRRALAKYDQHADAIIIYPPLLVLQKPEEIVTTLAHEIAHSIQLSSGAWGRYISRLDITRNKLLQSQELISMRSSVLYSSIARGDALQSNKYENTLSKSKIVLNQLSEISIFLKFITEGFAIVIECLVALRISKETYINNYEKNLAESYKTIYKNFIHEILGVEDYKDSDKIIENIHKLGEWVGGSDKIIENMINEIEALDKETKEVTSKFSEEELKRLQTLKICRRCGGENEPGVTKCRFCGSPL